MSMPRLKEFISGYFSITLVGLDALIPNTVESLAIYPEPRSLPSVEGGASDQGNSG